jgi:hypothetical protein
MTITESAQKRLVVHSLGKIGPYSLVGGLLRFITPQGSENQLTLTESAQKWLVARAAGKIGPHSLVEIDI